MADDEPVPLRHSIEQVFEFLGAPPIEVVASLRGRWEEIVGPGLAEATEPVAVVEGVLTVRCDDGAWASQLTWMEAQIKARYEQVFPGRTLTKVVVQRAR